MNKPKVNIDEKINSIIEKFDYYLKIFDDKYPYNDPRGYFHEKVIGLRRSKPLEQLLQDNTFIECLYAVIVSWGMNRTDNSAKMKCFNEFKKAVQKMGHIILPLKDVTLANYEEGCIRLLHDAFDYSVMQSKRRLVGNSTTLHHLLPDLIPPIDGENILKFLGKKTPDYKDEEIETFEFVIEKFKYMHDQIDWNLIKYDGTKMNTSRPKLIDNVIIAYNIENIKQPKKIEKIEEKRKKKEEKKKEMEEFKTWKESKNR